MKTIGMIIVFAILGLALFVGCSSTGTHQHASFSASSHHAHHAPCADKLCEESML